MLIKVISIAKTHSSVLSIVQKLVNHQQFRAYCCTYSVQRTTSTMEKPWPKIILFGDSLTQYSFSQDGCWGALIADFLQRKCDVVNRGFSGYNTRWCKVMLPKVVTKNDAADTQLVTILLGANDSVDSVRCPKQHVPLEEYKQNMKEIIQYFMDIGIERQRIVVISPPPCVERKWEAECKATGKPFGKYLENTKPYAVSCMEVAKECGTSSVDLFTSMYKQDNWEDMLNDGLHFSTQGSEFLFDQLKPHLEKINDALSFQWPYWSDIDNNNPHAELDKY